MSRLLCVVNPPPSPPTRLATYRYLQTAVYELGPLADGTNYVTPQKDDEAQKKCGCNTIIYSLYTACSVCQRNTTAVPMT